VILSVFAFLAACYALPAVLPPVVPAAMIAAALLTGLSGRSRRAASLLLVAAAAAAGAAVHPARPGASPSGGGVWSGRVETVTRGGVMIGIEGHSLWSGSRSLASAAAAGDSVTLLGFASRGFLSVDAWSLRPSASPAGKAREWLCDRWESRIRSPTASSLVRALLAGDRSGITGATRLLFRNSGVSHMLAVSGLHVGIIAGLFLLPRRSGRRLRRRSVLPVVTVLVLYTILTGARPSTVRAAVMASAVLLLAAGSGMRMCYLSLWCATAVLTAVILPGSIHDRGAQMSFAAVLSLILLSPPRGARSGPVTTALAAGLTVTVALAPLVSATYGGFAPQAPVATLVSIPFMLATMLLGVLVLLPPLAAGAAVLVEWCTWAWTGVIGLLAMRPVALSGTAAACAWGGILLTMACLRWRRGFTRRFR